MAVADVRERPVPGEGHDPLDASLLTRLATAYLTRYAASSLQLRRVLARKVRRWHQRMGRAQPEADVLDGLIQSTIAALLRSGIVNDGTLAAARAGRLVAKGLPSHQVRRKLAADGLNAGLQDVEDALEADPRVQARRYAARKRLGPFRTGERDRFREKDIRSLVRVGFEVRDAIAIVDAPTDCDLAS